MIQLWKRLKNFSRAKFLIQWAEERYRARLVSHEEYLDLAKIWAELVVEERGDDLTECERDLNKILRIAWDTISDRDCRMEELRERTCDWLRRLPEPEIQAIHKRHVGALKPSLG
jgi:hypothetical protein